MHKLEKLKKLKNGINLEIFKKTFRNEQKKIISSKVERAVSRGK